MAPIGDGQDTSVKALVARTFDEAAASYDTVGPEYFGRFGRRLVELAEIAPGMRVLDVGCGAGAALIPAAEAVGPDGDVIGIDLSAAMVARARAAAAERRLTNVEVRTGDAATPGVAAGDRDRVLAAQVLFFLDELGPALRAYRHILRPGGRLAVSSWGPDDRRWQGVFRTMFAAIPEGAAPNLTPSGDAFRNDESVAAALSQAGFTDVRTISETYDVVFDSADQWLSWTRSHGARAYWDAIPADRRASTRRATLDALRPLADPAGRLSVPTTVRYTLAERG